MQAALQACDRPPGFSELAFEATAPPMQIGCFTDEFKGTFLIQRETSGGDLASKSS